MSSTSIGSLVSDKWDNEANRQLSPVKPSTEDVDALADELVRIYSNPGYEKWYCGIIYEFGLKRVRAWQKKSSSGKSPGKLFSHYVRQARAASSQNRMSIARHGADELPDEYDYDKPVTIDDIDAALHQFGIDNVQLTDQDKENGERDF